MDNYNEGAEQETQEIVEPVEETKEQSYTQADIDRIVSKALETRERNLNSEWERKHKTFVDQTQKERMVKEQDFKSYATQLEQEVAALKLEKETAEEFSRGDMIQYLPFVTKDLSTLAGRVEFAESLNKFIDEQVRTRLKSKVGSPAPERSSKPTGPKAVKDMSSEEYKQYKKERGIY